MRRHGPNATDDASEASEKIEVVTDLGRARRHRTAGFFAFQKQDRHPRVGGDPGQQPLWPVHSTLGSRLRGNDVVGG